MKVAASLGSLLVLSLTVVSQAAIIATPKDSANFDYRYEQDVDSSSQDLDGNTVDDFFAGFPAQHPSIAGGIASFSDGDFYRTDFGGSITRANFADNAVFTVEISAQMLTTGSADGIRGTMGVFWRDNGADEDTEVLYVGDSTVKTFNGTVISTADNTDGFHTFRFARDSDGEFWFWRDNVLLAQDIASQISGGADGLFVGDIGSPTSGDWNLDYLRIDEGAFAPVPEPSSFIIAAMLGLIGIGYGSRRRILCVRQGLEALGARCKQLGALRTC